jgi:hypothetical protein
VQKITKGSNGGRNEEEQVAESFYIAQRASWGGVGSLKPAACAESNDASREKIGELTARVRG